MMAHSKTEAWLTCTGQAAHWNADYSDMKYAYQKIEIYAYEKDVELSGDSYTVYLGSNEDGTIIVDIFMEQKDVE